MLLGRIFMKKVFALIACAVIGITSASALSFKVGVTGDYVGWATLGSGSGFHSGGGGTAFFELPYVGFEVGYIGTGYIAGLEAGVYGYIPFTLAPGLSLYPKAGVDALIAFGILTGLGLDVTAGVGVEYNFSKLLGLGLFVRAEALVDALIVIVPNFGVALGPRVKFGIGYQF
jgi:hypothetical protein